MQTLATLQLMVQQMTELDLDFGLNAAVGTETIVASDYTAALNIALRYISRRLVMVSAEVEITLTEAQLAYNTRGTAFSQEIILPFTIIIAGQPLNDRFARSYGLWSYHELQRQFPTFRTDPAGVPSLACFLGQNGGSNLLIYPPPNTATVNAGDHFGAGIVTAPPLVNSGDIPAIPEECHESVAALATVLATIPTATEEEAWQRMEQLGRFQDPVEWNRNANIRIAEAYMGSSAIFNLYLEQDQAPAVPRVQPQQQQ